MSLYAIYIFIGFSAGILSGFLGIGGGIIVVPALVLLGGLSQHQAQGTTLAMMVPPIGLLAALAYYNKGFVDIKIAALLCAGFFIGGFIGAHTASGIPEPVLKKLFGCILLAAAGKLLISP